MVIRLSSLPGRIVSPNPKSEDVGESVFTLTEQGDVESYILSYIDGTRFVVDGATKRIWGTVRPPNTTDDLATYFLGPILGFVLRRVEDSCASSDGGRGSGRRARSRLVFASCWMVAASRICTACLAEACRISHEHEWRRDCRCGLPAPAVAFAHGRRLAEGRGGWPLVALGRPAAAFAPHQEGMDRATESPVWLYRCGKSGLVCHSERS